MGSPPPIGSKKDVLKFQSVKSIVIPAAKTGNDNNSSTAVIRTAQTNKGIQSQYIPGRRILITVVIKFIAPKSDERPAICKLKIAISTLGPEWARPAESGG
jgi:hypothetical protein